MGTSQAAFTSGADSERPHFLNAGHNSAGGHRIRLRCWPQQPDTPLELIIRTVDGELIRSYRSDAGQLSADAGANRFHWNMRYEGAAEVEGVDGWWERPDGPTIVPGQYEAELLVGGARSATALFGTGRPSG